MPVMSPKEKHCGSCSSASEGLTQAHLPGSSRALASHVKASNGRSVRLDTVPPAHKAISTQTGPADHKSRTMVHHYIVCPAPSTTFSLVQTLRVNSDISNHDISIGTAVMQQETQRRIAGKKPTTECHSTGELSHTDEKVRLWSYTVCRRNGLVTNRMLVLIPVATGNLGLLDAAFKALICIPSVSPMGTVGKACGEFKPVVIRLAIREEVINVIRNPKDVFASSFHYYGSTSYMVKPGPQSEFLHKFLNGKGCFHTWTCVINSVNLWCNITRIPFGSWFDHVKSWLNAEDKDHIMYICYEEMIMVRHN
ncbi:Sulfotransferase family cytosolic 2B member 1 [Channa argus]|uniref:Sulfotransferase n=1 Tax=Channa argus TaxID=215402 RepID=A0A6G1QQ20_CHAAH|nr:Sulfotransferase family cytosolic 2B member 1 [Channa argus]